MKMFRAGLPPVFTDEPEPAAPTTVATPAKVQVPDLEAAKAAALARHQGALPPELIVDPPPEPAPPHHPPMDIGEMHNEGLLS